MENTFDSGTVKKEKFINWGKAYELCKLLLFFSGALLVLWIAGNSIYLGIRHLILIAPDFINNIALPFASNYFIPWALTYGSPVVAIWVIVWLGLMSYFISGFIAASILENDLEIFLGGIIALPFFGIILFIFWPVALPPIYFYFQVTK